MSSRGGRPGRDRGSRGRGRGLTNPSTGTASNEGANYADWEVPTSEPTNADREHERRLANPWDVPTSEPPNADRDLGRG